MPEYKRGTRDGVRWAVHWLHERAQTMNDPHAKAVLNSAAFGLGTMAARTELPPVPLSGEEEPANG